MNILAKIGVVICLCLTFVGVNSAANYSSTNFEQIGQQLRPPVNELREIGKAMKAHSQVTMPATHNKDLVAHLKSERRELLATADAAIKLAAQIEVREKIH